MFASPVAQLAAGLALGALVSVLAWRAGSLSRSGALAAALVGMLVFGFGGVAGSVLLLAFFISSSGLTRLMRRTTAGVAENYAKGGQRDAAQVLGNGGLASVFMIGHALYPEAWWPWVGFAASLAAVNADTWATELGVLNRTPPRLVTNGKSVEPGTSGAVSIVGSLAALGGSAWIALLAILLLPGLPDGALSRLVMFAGLTLAGIAGAFFDSWVGATVQAIYYCPTCQKETERHPLHSCGTPTQLQRGWSWLSNDWVNFFCSLVGAGVGILLS